MDLQPRAFKFLPVNYEKPSIIGAYSLNRERKFQNDMSQLRYLKIPQHIDIDLKTSEIIPAVYNSKERVKQLTNFIMCYPKQCLENNRVNADFVCFRGVLRFLMSTPYENYKIWTIDAVKLKETIYMDMDSHTHLSETPSINFCPSERALKFQKGIMSLDPFDEVREDPEETIYENEEFCTAMSTTIDNQVKIIFGMQSAGVESNNFIESLDDLRISKLIDLKTYRVSGNFRYLTPYLSLKWWCQSFIGNIEKIHVGIRNDDFVINKVMTFSTNKLEANNRAHWSKYVCLNFLKNFLKAVQKDMDNVDDSRVIFRYKWNPLEDEKIRCTKLEEQNDFLSEEYVAFIKNLG